MNKFLLQIVFLLFVTCTYSQFIFDFSKKEYIPCEITLTNGSTITGYIKDFDEPNAVEIQGFNTSLESQYNLDRKSYKFRKELDGKKEDIDMDDIQSISLKEEDKTITYEKIKLKTINAKLEVVDLDKEVLIPLIRPGIISLYGIKAYSCVNGSCQLSQIIAYIKHEDQEYAYIPLDYNKINLFNFRMTEKRFYKSFEIVGSDCPAFLEYLNELTASLDDKATQKAYKEAGKRFRKEVKLKLKEVKGSKNKRREADKLYTAYILKLYTDVIDEYASRCHDI